MKEGFSRAHPFLSRIRARHEETKPGSSRCTYAIVLEAGPISYQVGDSLAIFPENRPEEVSDLLSWFQAKADTPIFDKRANASCSLEEFLTKRANLSLTTKAVLEALVERGAQDLKPLLEDQNRANLQHYLQTHTLHELLSAHPPGLLSPTDWSKLALPLLPRFYSIANAPAFHPGELHLLVAHLQYNLGGKQRVGVASHFLAHLAEMQKTPVSVYLHPSPHFTLPEDPAAPVILIGPGTGVAPFRAFLQQRLITQSPGKNWLFFGERNRETDFYYAPFFLSLEKEGRLRLTLAFSRDQPEKRYVQHAMWEERKSLWEWISQGAFLYVCGDAEKMAKDVDATLQKIVREEGGKTEEESIHFLKELRKQKKYLLDVY